VIAEPVWALLKICSVENLVTPFDQREIQIETEMGVDSVNEEWRDFLLEIHVDLV
jgi:hypothetical protein